VPKRGIGKTSVEKIEDIARIEECSFLDAAELAIAEPGFGAKTQEALAQFVQLIRNARHYGGDLRDIVEMVVAKSGLIDALEAEHTDEARGRIENIKEFFGVAQEFEETHEDEDEDGYDGVYEGEEGDDISEEAGAGLSDGFGTDLNAEENVAEGGLDSETVAPMLIRFMEWLALRSDLDSIIESDDYLTLMTVHSAKGLEFPVVFIAGLEESLFPHFASSEEPAGLEEERRLAYVAITRARELLYLTHTQIRKLYGSTQTNPQSRFVAEIPKAHLRSSGVGSAGYLGLGWEKRGDRHGIFGSGTLRERDGEAIGAGGSGSRRGSERVYGSGGSGTVDKQQAELREERKAMVFAVGDAVDHKTFGRGVVTKLDGDALLVRFSKSGETKKLLKGFAPIVKIG
jgi:DNA helicase-2/ATP-dependent DNA helicase PcrA